MWNKHHALNYRFKIKGKRYQIYFLSPLWCLTTIVGMALAFGAIVGVYFNVVVFVTLLAG